MLTDSRPEEKPQPARWKRTWTLLSIVFSAGLLFYLYRVYFPEIRELEFRWPWFLAGTLLVLVMNFGIGAWKWRWVLSLHGIQLPPGQAFKLWVGLWPLGFSAPFQTGHLLYARVVQKGAGRSLGMGLQTMVFDRGLNLLAALLLVALGQLFLEPDHVMSHPLIMVGACLPGLAFLCLNLRGVAERLPASWQKIREALNGLDLQLPTRQKIKLLAAACLYQTTDILSAVFAALAVSTQVDPLAVAAAFPMIVLVSHAPFGFQSIGVREGLAVLWLGGGLSGAEAASVGFLVGMMECVIPAVVGLSCVRFSLRALSHRFSGPAPLEREQSSPPR